MIKEVKMYTVICDCCGVDVNDNMEYSCYSEANHAQYCAMDSDWIHPEENKHYCPDCFTYDDDDKLIISNSKSQI